MASDYDWDYDVARAVSREARDYLAAIADRMGVEESVRVAVRELDEFAGVDEDKVVRLAALALLAEEEVRSAQEEFRAAILRAREQFGRGDYIADRGGLAEVLERM